MTQTRSILVLYAHPNPAQSLVQKELHAAIQDLDGVVIRDLYRLHPHFYIDPAPEQAALRQADLIIFQHPLYWYSCPALLKEWQDVVLSYGFAYGPDAIALHKKDFLQVISIGAREATYQRDGGNRFTLVELLRPFEATARLCGLHYHQPFAVQAGSGHSAQVIQKKAQAYRQLLVNYLEHGPSALNERNRAEDPSHD
jgi:putative NADPH-quinone reductase